MKMLVSLYGENRCPGNIIWRRQFGETPERPAFGYWVPDVIQYVFPIESSHVGESNRYKPADIVREELCLKNRGNNSLLNRLGSHWTGCEQKNNRKVGTALVCRKTFALQAKQVS